MKNLITFGFLLVAGVVHAATLALPPYVYTGKIVNFERASVSALTDDAEIRVRSTNGVLLARSSVVTQKKYVENYRLIVPLSTQTTPTTAMVNEPVVFELQIGSTVYSAPSMFPVGLPSTPGGASVCNIVVGTDANHDGISDEYVSMLEQNEIPYWQSYYPSIGNTYDPDADYDGDGASNRHEYMAGTDPFDPEDRFRIIDFARSEDVEGAWKVTFFANRARSYTLKKTTRLATETPFSRTDFQQKDREAEGVAGVLNTSNSEAGVRTLIVLPDNPESSFFRLNVQ